MSQQPPQVSPGLQRQLEIYRSGGAGANAISVEQLEQQAKNLKAEIESDC